MKISWLAKKCPSLDFLRNKKWCQQDVEKSTIQRWVGTSWTLVHNVSWAAMHQPENKILCQKQWGAKLKKSGAKTKFGNWNVPPRRRNIWNVLPRHKNIIHKLLFAINVKEKFYNSAVVPSLGKALLSQESFFNRKTFFELCTFFNWKILNSVNFLEQFLSHPAKFFGATF